MYSRGVVQFRLSAILVVLVSGNAVAASADNGVTAISQDKAEHKGGFLFQVNRGTASVNVNDNVIAAL